MSNDQKFSLQESLGRIARNGAKESIGIMAKILPASVVSANGAMVKVKIEVLSDYNLPQIEIPVLGSVYVREPLQAGDAGILIPCDASISAISGQGTNTADLVQPPNMSAFAFLPIGNKKWKGVDGNMLVLTGVSDVMIRDNSHQLQLEDENASWNSLISQINNLLTDIASKINTAATTYTGMPPITFTQITAETNPVKPRA